MKCRYARSKHLICVAAHFEGARPHSHGWEWRVSRCGRVLQSKGAGCFFLFFLSFPFRGAPCKFTLVCSGSVAAAERRQISENGMSTRSEGERTLGGDARGGRSRRRGTSVRLCHCRFHLSTPLPCCRFSLFSLCVWGGLFLFIVSE